MKKRELVSKIMTKNLVKLNVSDSLSKAEALFKKNKIKHLPVVSGDKIVGMLGYSDLLRISFADATDDTGKYVESTVYDMFSLDQVMTSKVVCVESDDTIKEVAEILAREHFHALPVIEHDKLIGIITSTDIINFFLESFY